ncbi:MAG: hypothetical protein HY908_03070 [Myxococcales bacterium]|nr:hypothetical protein [Myxococcales bacterium]
MTAQQHHERQLVALKEDKSKKTLRNALIGGIAAVLIGGGLTTYFVVKASNEAEAERIAANAKAAAEKADLQRQLDELNAKIAQNEKDKEELAAQIKANEGNPEKIAELKAMLQAKEKEGSALKTQASRTGTGPAAAGPGPAKA